MHLAAATDKARVSGSESGDDVQFHIRTNKGTRHTCNLNCSTQECSCYHCYTLRILLDRSKWRIPRQPP